MGDRAELERLRALDSGGGSRAELEQLRALDQQPTQTAEPDSMLTRRMRNLAMTTVIPAAQAMEFPLVGAAEKVLPEGKALEYVRDIPNRVSELSDELKQKEAAQPAGFTLGNVGALEGQIAGTVGTGGLKLGASALGKYGPLVDRILQGAVTGDQMAGTSGMDAGKSAAVTAGISAALPPVVSGVAKLVSPATQTAAGWLAKKGVQLTPGMAFGETAKRIEEKIASMPIIGDIIKPAQRAAFESLNKVVYDDALAPIGEKLTAGKLGNEAFAEADDKVSAAYGSLLPKLRGAITPAFNNEVQAIQAMSANLPPAQQEILSHVLDKEVMSKFTQSGVMSGETLKKVEEQLGKLAKGYGANPDPYVRQMAGGIREAQAALRRMVEEVNPAQRGELQDVNASFAKLARIRDAVSAAGKQEGVFSPEQLLAASKKGDFTKGKRRFARGEAQGQELASKATQVMGTKVPNSGTFDRAAMGAGLLGVGGGAYAAHVPLAAATAVPYLPIGRELFNALAFRRPTGAAKFAKALQQPGTRRAALPASAALAQALLNGGQ